MKLYIGNKNYSSWSMRPWVLMRQADIPFEEVQVRFDSFAPGSEFKRHLAGLSPSGKVPVLHTEIDGVPQVIWDTMAIAEYLAERFPERRLWPVQAATRARARSASAEMHSGFGALRARFPLNIEASLPGIGPRALAEEPAVAADVARVTGLWRECLDTSGGPFLFGGFCIADAFFAPVVMRFRTYGVPLDGACERYAQHVTQAAGVVEWIAGALAEHDFRPFQEPYRSAPQAPAR
ncbi:MAG: glutathione S-transferase family protein [Burkholderiales bacterium]|nr:glutathione S-transferase family protein [Burkholderiales bacterium]OJX06664.1 MAG: glutathione S-transferase [Burkholderiales bacterium 70-64]